MVEKTTRDHQRDVIDTAKEEGWTAQETAAVLISLGLVKSRGDARRTLGRAGFEDYKEVRNDVS